MTKRAVLYARVSGDDRQNSSSSLVGQLEMCRKYADEKGFTVVAQLAEDSRGASGAVYDLPQLNEALKLAKAGKFDVLITRELDRLARGLAKQLIVEDEFSRLGVTIDYVIGEYDNNLEGQLNKHIRAVIAEYEREKINERMVRGRRRKAKDGYVVVHGNPPYGYEVEKTESGQRLVIHEPTARIVRMIFDLYVNEKLGSPNICKKLNGLGIPTPSISKKVKTTKSITGKWNQSQIVRIISSETYAGKWRYGKRNRQVWHDENYHIVVDVPPIVSREIFELAQKQRKCNTKAPGRPKRDYLLARRCLCGVCQASMVALTKADKAREYSYYRCTVRYQQDTHHMTRRCTSKTHFHAKYWDEVIWQEIRGFLANPSKVEKGISEYQAQHAEITQPLKDRMVIIDNLLAERQAELKRLLDLYLSGQFDQDMLFERKQRLEKLVASLHEEKEQLTLQMNVSLTDTQINELQEISKQIIEGLSEADEDFKTRRRIIEYLNVRVTFLLEDGKQVALLSCEFGHNKRLLYGDVTPHPEISSHPPESARSTNSHEEGEDKNMSHYTHNTDYNCN